MNEPTQHPAEVLVAEDDAVVRAMLRDILRGAGYSVHLAADGGEALASASSRSLDLALLDVMMPVADGFEVCRQLKERAQREGRIQPVLILTALDDHDSRVQGLALGADEYMAKPFAIDELLLRVRSLVERKRSFDELSRRYHHAERLGEMQRRLAAFLVHDFKNPLAALEANLELLQRHAGSLDPKGQHFLDDAESCTRRLSNLVVTLLDVYRLEEAGVPLRRERVPATRALSTCAAEFEPLARLKGIRLEVRVEPEALACNADPSLVQRVLGNLVTNAVRYTPQGRRIVLAGSGGEHGSVLLGVEDEAPRIAAEHRELIFEKFGRVETEAALPGHGLGLTFCRLAARAHGGDVWLEDGEVGNRFVVALPGAA